MPQDDKVKIKLSELTDMYDIEDDSKKPEVKEQKQKYEVTIEEEDEKLSEEFDEEF